MNLAPVRGAHACVSFPIVRVALTLTLALGLGAGTAAAAPGAAAVPPDPALAPAPAAESRPAPADPYDPTVPVGAVRAFLDACREGDYARAAERLDLSGFSADQVDTIGPRLAWQLKVVLDQELWIEYATLSRSPQGNLDDGLDPSLERVGTIEGDAAVEVFLERIPRQGGDPVWKFASGTVVKIPELYERYGYGVLGEVLPEPLMRIELLEVRLWQWIGLGLLVLAAWLASWIVVSVLRAVSSPLVQRTRTQLDDRIAELVLSPLRFLVGIGLFALGVLFLHLAEPAHDFVGNLLRGLGVVGMTWIALRVIDVLSALLDENLDRTGRTPVKSVVPLGRRAAKAVLVAIAFVVMLQNLGFNVTGLIAGLGVGGLAVALAAQKSVENLFGGVTLIADQPVRVGDFCRFGDGKLGIVEEIGLRSTQVRTLDRTVVTVPNSQFSELQIENFARRDRIRLYAVLGMRYETTPDQMRWLLAELRRVLVAHPRVAPEPLRVRFVAFGAHSLDLEVYAMVRTTDFNEFCAIREDIFLRFMDAVAASGTGFAFPSQTLYLGRDGGLDHDRTREAERTVQTWREEGSLPFPDFDPATVAAAEDSLDYPPRGSVAGSAPATDRV